MLVAVPPWPWVVSKRPSTSSNACLMEVSPEKEFTSSCVSSLLFEATKDSISIPVTPDLFAGPLSASMVSYLFELDRKALVMNCNCRSTRSNLVNTSFPSILKVWLEAVREVHHIDTV